MSLPFKTVKLTDDQMEKYGGSRFSRAEVIQQFKDMGVGRMIIIQEKDISYGTVRQYVSLANKWLQHHSVQRRLITRSTYADRDSDVHGFATKVICLPRLVPASELPEVDFQNKEDE